MKEILNRFLSLSKNTRALAAVGLSCLTLSVFLTYVKYTVLGLAVKIKLIEYYEGKVIILLILINLMFIFKDYVKKYIPKLFENNVGKKIESIDNQLLTLIPTFFMVMFAFVVKSDTKVEYLNTTYGLGFYMMWFGIILLVAHAFLYKNETIFSKLNKGINRSNNTKPVQNAENIANVQQSQNETNTVTNQTNTTNIGQETTHKFCVNCGTKCDSQAQKCPACGKEF